MTNTIRGYPAMTDELVGLFLSRIGEEFDGECHLTEAEARQIATLIEQLLNRVERLTEWLDALCDSVEREEAVNGSLSGALMSDLREARAALTGEHNG